MSLKIQCFDIHNNCRETCHNAHHNSRCDTQRKTNRDTQCEAIRYSCNSRNIFPIKFIQNLILKNLLWHHHWNNCKPAALSKHRIVVLVNAQEYLEWQTRLETIPLVINTNILKFFFPILQIQTWVQCFYSDLLLGCVNYLNEYLIFQWKVACIINPKGA